MFFFKHKKKAKREDEIKKLKKATLEKLEEASDGVKKVNEILDDPDVTLQIFYATRLKGKKK